ncbi:MAG TPA: helix-turn-helix transcriptional regulator [Longimicrobiales bacterium]|nr:helix-turn-helix transcriptional regulator [Longimicrobiales bacterium]
MPRGEFLGEFEQLVLLAVARLGEGAYGMSILDELRARADTEPAVASIYAALDRLERQGLVRSSLGQPTSERGGRAKRFYALEPSGALALERTRSRLAALWDGLDMSAGT